MRCKRPWGPMSGSVTYGRAFAGLTDHAPTEIYGDLRDSVAIPGKYRSSFLRKLRPARGAGRCWLNAQHL